MTREMLHSPRGIQHVDGRTQHICGSDRHDAIHGNPCGVAEDGSRNTGQLTHTANEVNGGRSQQFRPRITGNLCQPPHIRDRQVGDNRALLTVHHSQRAHVVFNSLVQGNSRRRVWKTSYQRFANDSNVRNLSLRYCVCRSTILNNDLQDI